MTPDQRASDSAGRRFDVAVIGGGFAGIACAVQLARRGRRVALIERRPTLGGRVHSHRDPATGDLVDNGPHLMVGGYHETRALLRILGTESRLRFQPRLELAMRDAWGESVFRRRLPGDLGLAAGLARMRGVTWRDVWRTRRLLPSARTANRAELDEMTCEEWFDRLGIPDSVRTPFLKPICTAALNDTPARASAALFANVLQRTFSGDGNDGLGFVTGPQSALFGVARESEIERAGGSVLTGRRAARVMFSGEEAVGVALVDGCEIPARDVVIAVPHRHVAELFDPSQGSQLDLDLFQALGAAPIVNIHLWLDREVVERSLVGLLGRPTQFIYNIDRIWPERSRLHRVVGIISGPTGDAEKSNQALVEQMMDDLRALFPLTDKAAVVHSVVVKEREATFSPRPGLLSRRPRPQSLWPNLWWAGDWTRTPFPSTIEGAVDSGFAAAEELLMTSSERR